MGAKDKQQVLVKACKDTGGTEEIARKEIKLVIRGTGIIMCLYFLELLALCMFCHNPYILLFGITGGGAFAVVLYLCHRDKIRQAALLSYAVLLLYVITFVCLFGWKSGVQNLLLGLLPLILIADFICMKCKVIYAVLICVLRFFLFYFQEIYRGMNELNDAAMVYMDIINVINVFVLVSNCVIVFSEVVYVKEERMSKNNKELATLASEDMVTGLENRRSTMFSLKRAVSERDADSNKRVSIVIGDIDFFKHVNDEYGHDCGDVVLRQLSDKFREFMEDKGRVGRWGGEEFLFLFENTDGKTAYSYMQELLEWIRQKEFTYEEEHFHLTMTFGLSEYDGKMGVDGIIVDADRKLYVGKESGRDTIIF